MTTYPRLQKTVTLVAITLLAGSLLARCGPLEGPEDWGPGGDHENPGDGDAGIDGGADAGTGGGMDAGNGGEADAGSGDAGYRYLIIGRVYGEATKDCPDPIARGNFDDWKAYYTKVVSGSYSSTYSQEREALLATMKAEWPGQRGYYVESSHFEAGSAAKHAVLIEYPHDISPWDCRPQVLSDGYGTSYEQAKDRAVKSMESNGGSYSGTYHELAHENW